MAAAAVMLSVTAMAQTAVTPPFSASFDSGKGDFTMYDGNQDGNTIKTVSYSGYNYSNCLYYVGNADNAADEWLFTPALNLQAGLVYEMTYYYKLSSSGKTYSIQWNAGASADAAAMTVTEGEAVECQYNYNSFIKETVSVTVPSDGVWYLGMHLTGEAGQNNFYIDELNIAEGVNAAMPAAPVVVGPQFSVVGDKLHVAMTITMPSKSVGGTDLGSAPITLCIKRADKEEPVTMSAVPGAEESYTDEDALLEATTYSVYCKTDIDGQVAEVASSPKMGIPKAVEGLDVVQNGNLFELSWDAVTEATDATAVFIPSTVVYTVKSGAVVVAEKISATQTSYTATMPEEGQEALTFTITAFAGTKASTAVTSDPYIVGDPIAGGFEESFANRAYQNSVWTVQDGVTGKWQPSIGKSYPTINPQDNDGGCLEFGYDSGKELNIYSPLLDLSSLANPKLKFWVYLQPTSTYKTAIQAGFKTAGTETLVGDLIAMNSGDAEGWTEFTVDVPAEATATTTQLFLKGTGDGTYYKIYIDNITILGYLDHNLAVSAESTAKEMEIGEEAQLPVTVSNVGSNSESEYTVKVMAGDEQIYEVAGVKVAPGKSVVFDIPFKALPKYADTDVVLDVEVVMASDMDNADNMADITVPVAINDLANVTGLKATSAEDGVTLNWIAPAVSSEPVVSNITESFETWENGTTEAQDGWTFVDAAGINHAGLGQSSLNNNTAFAAMVIENCPGKYSYDSPIVAYEGVKCLAVTPSYSYGGTIDSWIISPQVQGGSALKFYCKSYSTYATDSFDILYSATGTDTGDFSKIDTKTAPYNSWMECTVTLPEDAKYFAIHCNSSMRSTALLLDSFSFKGMTVPPTLTGFNVYRNHALIATLPADATSHKDTEASETQSSYRLTSLYDTRESAYSDEVIGAVSTGIENILDSEENAEYYNLQGLRILNPAKGEVVIVRKGDKSYKAVIR